MQKFWKEAAISHDENGYNILLDGRGIKTPEKRSLAVPHIKMADAILAEWDGVADGAKIDPAAMPFTGFANAAIDKIAPNKAEFAEGLGQYAEADLFCYHATSPQELVERQAAIWTPRLNWAAAYYGVEFTIIHGIMHQDQPAETRQKLRGALNGLSAWQLAAMAKLIPISGSLVASLMIVENAEAADALWPEICLDELWQEEQWGADEFAIKNRRDREKDFLLAAQFLKFMD
ncbi:hypothetical protein LPB140_11700 [Sphingorhabdus lutea]|uniref:ATPase n=1 Tax=Sphingorhabdus lutea TaxID=1913578 RepID=A0A1L3JDZ0_9SPHN|nr:ATP12 family protein [Sphingorhabdus lutea]APG63340.1 hypothetical protein LPB140_11700 [Sphingorhabdus lutea]